MREVLSILLTRAGYSVDTESTGKRGLERLEASEPYDVVITDLVMPGAGGMEVLAAAKRRKVETQVIVITAHGSRESAVEALRGGAYDYVMKPFKNEELRLLVERAVEKGRLLRENQDLRREVAGRFEIERIVGSSQAMKRVVELCRRMGSMRTNVLITGESGTGKELIARALHAFGPRSTESFVTVNCGALPESLMESELFGHERGAFTGAVRSALGLFREADGGTLFLDEVGEIPLQVQVKLLRAIQERKIRPVGGSTESEVDVRIVAASNRDLEVEVKDGRFRSDLFYRLNVVCVDIPPLRERPEDIPALIQHFLEVYSQETGRSVRSITKGALQILRDYRYPGNVRELENIIERAVALSPGEVIDVDVLPSMLIEKHATPLPQLNLSGGNFDLDDAMRKIEKSYIIEALREAQGVQTKAAEILGISFRSFRYRVKKLELDVEAQAH